MATLRLLDYKTLDDSYEKLYVFKCEDCDSLSYKNSNPQSDWKPIKQDEQDFVPFPNFMQQCAKGCPIFSGSSSVFAHNSKRFLCRKITLEENQAYKECCAAESTESKVNSLFLKN
jgi:hypothetical protein